MKPRRPLRHVAALAATAAGLTRLCRALTAHEPCVLMFHGVRDREDARLLDPDLHVPVELFEKICACLAKSAQVVPLARLTEALRQGDPLPDHAVALTFDDGYASNHDLAFPLLEKYALPATLFPATGFLDGDAELWFNQVDYALATTRRTELPDGPWRLAGERSLADLASRKAVLAQLLAQIKTLPQPEIPTWVAALESALESSLATDPNPPAALRPLTWDQARRLKASGLVDFGGHTHRHWIVGRCTPEVAAEEIDRCRERLTTELGEAPRLFAYPNGAAGDWNEVTEKLLRENGFTGAVTTLPGRVRPGANPLALPRYGTPVSVADARMTTSGAYEKLRQWRRGRASQASLSPAAEPPPRRTVLHIIRTLGTGGAEMMLCNLVEQMKDGPWRTVVVRMAPGNAEWQMERVRQAADAVYTLDDRPQMRLRHVRKLRAIIRAERPDVVQTWIHRVDLAGGVVARTAGCRSVVWGLHSLGLGGSPGESGLKLRLYQAALRLASHFVPRLIVSCSNAGITTHEQAGYPRRRMLWIPNGIRTDRFVPDAASGAAVRRELGVPAEAPVVGFTGRFHPVKGLPVFFRAAALLQRRLPDAHFLLCGGVAEDLEPEATAAWRALPAPDQVRFIPYGGQPERFYPACSLFSMSSTSEALPMVLLEAMSCGVPCVATDVGDCAEVLGDWGRTVPPGDAAALAAAWEQTLRIPTPERQALAPRLRQYVAARFSLQSCATQYEAAYNELLTGA